MPNDNGGMNNTAYTKPSVGDRLISPRNHFGCDVTAVDDDRGVLLVFAQGVEGWFPFEEIEGWENIGPGEWE